MKTNNSILLSSAYLPPVHYFMAIINSDKVYIEKHETYHKQTFRNRCEIYSANGKLTLTIPVNRINGNHTRIDEIELSDQFKWQILHWRAIKIAYSNSPFFLYYMDDLSIFFEKKFTNLFEFNMQLLLEIMELVGINKEILVTESFEKKPQNLIDYRYLISPKASQTTFHFNSYYQSFSAKHGFIPGLSILDILFNMGPETLSLLK